MRVQLTINGTKIEVLKFYKEKENELYFQFLENPTECEFLYQLYCSQDVVIFEVDIEKYADFIYHGLIRKFDRNDDEFDEFFIIIEIIRYLKKEKQDAV